MTKTGQIRAWLFLLAGLTFLAGGAVVFAGQRLFVGEETRALAGDEWREELSRTLGLSSSQDQTLGQILDGQRMKTRELLNATETRLEELGRETNTEILDILDEGQKSKYQKLCRGN